LNDLTELLLKIGQLTNKRYSRQHLRLRIARSEGHEALVERPVPPHVGNPALLRCSQRTTSNDRLGTTANRRKNRLRILKVLNAKLIADISD